MGNVVLRIGDDISTDIIYPGRFMATVLPTETPAFAFADNTEFNKKLKNGEVPAGSIIVAGQNFGCGSSREQAASCLKGHELTIIAKHFSRIFLQNSINLGLQMVICPDIDAKESDDLRIETDYVQNISSAKKYKIVPLSQARQAIIDAGGLIPYTRDLLVKKMKSRA